MLVNEEYRGLVYPWGRKSPVGYGEPLEVAPGVWWVRFEMPGGLDHINIWLLEEADGWTVVDTCMKLDSAKAQWESLFHGIYARKTDRSCHLYPLTPRSHRFGRMALRAL